MSLRLLDDRATRLCIGWAAFVCFNAVLAAFNATKRAGNAGPLALRAPENQARVVRRPA